MGGGYQTSSVKRYSGARTIAPLDSYSVKQKFGNYVDPIYNIKIFNESVILRSSTPDAKVKSVLNGKVVFAKATPMLEKCRHHRKRKWHPHDLRPLKPDRANCKSRLSRAKRLRHRPS